VNCSECKEPKTTSPFQQCFLADPKAVLVAAGMDLPEWFTVSAREDDAAELSITLPALRDPDTDLSDDQLEQVAGDGITILVYWTCSIPC